MRAIGEQMGLRFHGAKSEPKELSDAERWAEFGRMPDGSEVKTQDYEKLPITVREFMVQLKRGKIGRA